MDAAEENADKTKIHPNPFLCPFVSVQSLRSVPLISFGFTTALPRPGRESPFVFSGGTDIVLSDILATSNLRFKDRSV